MPEKKPQIASREAVRHAGLGPLRDRNVFPPMPSAAVGPLESGLRAQMEARFDCDFSGVRIHTGHDAAIAAKAVDAAAYTIGRHIVFGAAAYSPATTEGRRLSDPSGGPMVAPADRFEWAADRAAALATADLPSAPTRRVALAAGAIGAGVLQRQPAAATAGQPDIREQIIGLAESPQPANRQRALDLIMSTYYERPAHFAGILYTEHPEAYRPRNKPPPPLDIDTGAPRGQPEFGGEQQTVVGPRFFTDFRRRYDRRVRSIGHELQHVGQRSPPDRRTWGSTLETRGPKPPAAASSEQETAAPPDEMEAA